MTADILPFQSVESVRPARPVRTLDAAFAAIPRLTRLAAALAESRVKPSRWREPPVFFFDPARQAELEATRVSTDSPSDAISTLIASELPELYSSVEVRRVARAIPGLRAAAAHHPAGTQLAELLAVPDDEPVLVLHPKLRAGFRVFVRGIADIAQFHLLLLDAVEGDVAGPPLPSRFRIACAEANPVIPAGVPMVAEARFQFFKPTAIQSDGSIPSGFHGCEHWLWHSQPLASIPRIDGERVILLGEPAFRQTWEVERRFPAMPAEVRLLEVLNPFRVAEELSRLAGRPIPIHSTGTADAPALTRAA